MLDGWLLFRGVYFPVKFEDNVLAVEQFFAPEKEAGLVQRILSVSLQERFASEEDQHSYGVGVAGSMNARLQDRKGRPLSDTEVRRYLGFYRLPVSGLCERKWKHHTISVYWDEENGNNLHYTIEVRPNGMPDVVDQRGKASKIELLQIIKFLKNLAEGPVLHIDPESNVPLAQQLGVTLRRLPDAA